MDAQNRQILAYLQTGKTLTPLEALQKFGCFRLAVRIWDLRDQGHQIIRFMDESVDQYGNVKRYARYALKEDT